MNERGKTAIYPGSFDPCTNGHLDIITRAAKVFDKLYVAVLVNSKKKSAFSTEERVEFLKKAVSELPNVEVISFSGLLAEYTKKHDIGVIVKGLRAVSDFEYEFQMALTNKEINPETETLFMTTSTDNMYVSSSIVREIAAYGGNIKNLVPPMIENEISKKLFDPNLNG